MKFRIMSDLHLEFSGWRPPPGDEDIVVLAGDIAEGRSGVVWARTHFRDIPIIYVPGNHEYYGYDIDDLRVILKESGRAHEVQVLDGDEVILNGVRILGATLWTDFAVCGESPESVAYAMQHCAAGMTDYHVIRRWGGPLQPHDTREIHLGQRDWLRRAISGHSVAARNFSGPTVVVTHHAPSPRSIATHYRGSILNASFASDLSDLMAPHVKLWVHGHMHNSLDYVEHGTRVVCNPRGYVPFEPNLAFDPSLVVEI